MNGLLTYIKASYQELMFKVTWPTFAELQNSAVVVLIASLIFTLFIWGMDFVSEKATFSIYDLLMS